MKLVNYLSKGRSSTIYFGLYEHVTSLSGLVHVTSLSAVTLWEVGNVVLDLVTCHKSLGLEKKESSVYIKLMSIRN